MERPRHSGSGRTVLRENCCAFGNTEESAAYATPKAAEASPSPLQQGRGLGRGVARCRLFRGLGSTSCNSDAFPGVPSDCQGESGGRNEMRICHAGHTRGLAFGARTRQNQTGVRLCSCASGELGSACSTGTVQTTSMGWGLAKASRALRTSAPQSRSRLNTSTKVISGTPNRRR